MKNTLITIVALFIFAACSETQTTTPETTISAEKKTKGQTTTTYTVVNVTPTNWNITADTSNCGTLVLRWVDQNRPVGASNYYIDVIPKVSTCAGGLNASTNILYYTYGWGCSFSPNQTYFVTIKYNWKDDVNKKIFIYSSTSVSITTGRGAWNCN